MRAPITKFEINGRLDDVYRRGSRATLVQSEARLKAMVRDGSGLLRIPPDKPPRDRTSRRQEIPNCCLLTHGFTRPHMKLHLSVEIWKKERNMAAKVETLRITARPNTSRRKVVARFAAAGRDWARRGQLGPTPTSEMRAYTGAR